MVMRGVRFASMLVVYLAPRLNTSDGPRMAVAGGELGPSLRWATATTTRSQER
jgi:hypothetical protein